MSFNQSNQQRGASGAYGKGSGAGAGGPAPSPSISSNCSFKKSNNNAQGGQSRANVSSVHSSDSINASIPRGTQNGTHVQPQLHGASDVLVTSTIAKQTEPSATQRSSRPVPKAPTSQSASVSADTTATTTPTKAPGDGSKAFPFQFGSISHGFMNGMQIPTRTSSAPPNLDEQKRDQTRHDAFRSVPPVPTPSIPKQQLPRKDPGFVDQMNTSEVHPVPKTKKDVQVSPAPHSQSQKPSGLPMTVSKLGTHVHGVSEAPEHARDMQNVISVPSGTSHVTIKPASGSVRENAVDLLPNSSPVVEKGESHKPSKPSGKVSLSHSQRDLEISTDSSFQLSKSVSDTLVSKSAATNVPEGALAAVSAEGHVFNSLSPATAAPTEESLPVGANFESRRRETLSRSKYQKGLIPFESRRRETLSRSKYQKGLIPSPRTPLQMMHKAEKYEVGKVTDEEQAKQRQLKGILNKLTPQNFEKLFELVKAVNIDTAVTLTGVISQIFDKALMEPTFCEMYANICYDLAGELPDFSEDNEKITFKRLLLNKCQEEFERGEREQEEANKADEEVEIKQTKEEREEKRVKSRRRMLGNIRLIGELYKKKMLTERIMHECIKKLLGNYRNPDEDNVEALCKLMSTIGEMIDHSKAKEHMDAYFDRMKSLSNNMKLSSRVRFMLKDSIDLRKNKWQLRRVNKLLNLLLINE